MKRVDIIFETIKKRNAEWTYGLFTNGKFFIKMNGRLQRIFRDADEARTMFEIYTSK